MNDIFFIFSFTLFLFGLLERESTEREHAAADNDVTSLSFSNNIWKTTTAETLKEKTNR